MKEQETGTAISGGSSIEYADMLILRFGEFTLKGKNRARFEKTVLRHVKEMVKPYPQVVLSKEFGRIYVQLNGEPAGELAASLKNVFGIASISPVKVSLSEFDDILSASRTFLEIIVPAPGTTFKVNARRVWKEFPHGSIEMNKLISTPLLQGYPGLIVDVKSPQMELKIEIREGHTYIFCENIPGVGGFPLGTNGRLCSSCPAVLIVLWQAGLRCAAVWRSGVCPLLQLSLYERACPPEGRGSCPGAVALCRGD